MKGKQLRPKDTKELLLDYLATLNIIEHCFSEVFSLLF